MDGKKPQSTAEKLQNYVAHMEQHQDARGLRGEWRRVWQHFNNERTMVVSQEELEDAENDAAAGGVLGGILGLRNILNGGEVEYKKRLGKIHSGAITTTSLVLNQAPLFEVEGYPTEQDEKIAATCALLLNRDWAKTGQLRAEMVPGVNDSYLMGVGVWMTTFKPVGEGEDGESRELIAGVVVDQALQTGQPERDAADLIDPDLRRVEGVPISVHVPAEDFIIDPMVPTIEHTTYLGRRFYTPLRLVMEAMPGLETYPEVVAGTSQFTEEYVALLEIWERVHEAVEGKKPRVKWVRSLVCATSDVTLVDQEPWPDWSGPPFDSVSWTQSRRTFFNSGDAGRQIDLVDAEEEVFSEAMFALPGEGSNAVLVDGAVLGENDHRLEVMAVRGVGNVGVLKKPDGSQQPISAYIHSLPITQMSGNAVGMMGMIDGKIQDASGLSPNQRGQALKSETSATEAAEIARASQNRSAQKYMAVESAIGAVGRRRLQLMMQYSSAADVARIAGKDAGIAWAQNKRRFTKPFVQSGLNISVSQGSMRPVEDPARARVLLELINIPALQGVLNVAAVAKEALRNLGISALSGLINDIPQGGPNQGNPAAPGGAPPVPPQGGLPPGMPGGGLPFPG